MSFKWYLLHQNTVPNSEKKIYNKQKAMLPAEYEVPSAIAEVTKDLLVFHKTGIFVNPKKYARCKCRTSDGELIKVGYFDENGLDISKDWIDSQGVDYRDDDVGIAASRKFPSETFRFSYEDRLNFMTS
jgi:hypothetical protein